MTQTTAKEVQSLFRAEVERVTAIVKSGKMREPYGMSHFTPHLKDKGVTIPKNYIGQSEWLIKMGVQKLARKMFNEGFYLAADAKRNCARTKRIDRTRKGLMKPSIQG